MTTSVESLRAGDVLVYHGTSLEKINSVFVIKKVEMKDGKPWYWVLEYIQSYFDNVGRQILVTRHQIKSYYKKRTVGVRVDNDYYL